MTTIILGVAASLFVVAVVALLVWAFRTFFLGKSSSANFLRPREKRLGVVETASVDGKRKLLLVRRDDVEHLLIIGGPVDVVVETGIKGRPHLGAAARRCDHRQGREPPRPRLRKNLIVLRRLVLTVAKISRPVSLVMGREFS